MKSFVESEADLVALERHELDRVMAQILIDSWPLCSYIVLTGVGLRVGAIFDIVYRSKPAPRLAGAGNGVACPDADVGQARDYAKYNSFELRVFESDPP